MAQIDAGENLQETPQMEMRDSTSVSFKFNAQAPEFVPRSQTQMPMSGYICPYFQFLGGDGGAGSDWFYVGDQEQIQLFTNPNVVLPNYSKNVPTDDLQKKIIKQQTFHLDLPITKQPWLCHIHSNLVHLCSLKHDPTAIRAFPYHNMVEYQFSDMSLLANDSLMRHMNKDREGFVPISVVANSKKIKSLVSNNHLLAQALRASSKLVVSNDGKKVRRKHAFTDRDKEELQSRAVVAENLPEDYSHQNLEKIFNVVGSVKSIRICHPHESNSPRAKGDCIISNKLHALVEYATTEIAEKAVEKLSDERNWRKGLRVRLLLRCSPKSVLKSWKSEFDGLLEDDEDEPLPESSEDSSHQLNKRESVVDSTAEENAMGSRKGWGRVRGKTKWRFQNHGARGLLAPSPQSSGSSSNIKCEASAKQVPKGPRMPDGTRGFSMGRGKPIAAPALAC